MDRLLSRLHRNRLQAERGQVAPTEGSTAPTIDTFDNIDVAAGSLKDTAYPLEFLSDERFWEATIVRSAIVNAIGNIRATEERCRSDYQYQQQNLAQLDIRTQVHRNQVQRLAQLGNRHAQLCYSYNHSELLSGTVTPIEDPTYRRAIHGCMAEVDNLDLRTDQVHQHHPTHPSVQHPLVLNIIAKWYSPAFQCTFDEFHREIWWRHRVADLGNIAGTRDFFL
jgi:hypothetical protein